MIRALQKKTAAAMVVVIASLLRLLSLALSLLSLSLAFSALLAVTFLEVTLAALACKICFASSVIKATARHNAEFRQYIVCETRRRERVLPNPF